MKTSYFGKLKSLTNPVAICGKEPSWFAGPLYKKLAPKYHFFKDFKDGIIDEHGYIKHFIHEVLNPLNPKQTYNEIIERHGEDATLLCYEKPDEFCHRQIVAAWFKHNLDIEIQEVDAIDNKWRKIVLTYL